MRSFWLLIHVLGFTLWLGAGIATMVAGVAAKRFAPDARLAAYRLTSAVQRILVGPGAVAVLVSGVALSMSFMRQGVVPGWLVIMMLAGLVGALVSLGVGMPTAARLGRLELDVRGELPESFAGLRRRLVVTASIGGGLGLVALVAGTVLRS
ncbi:MAG: hypothetical protein ACREMF_09990 [Gemmatimonadales bacterium]